MDKKWHLRTGKYEFWHSKFVSLVTTSVFTTKMLKQKFNLLLNIYPGCLTKIYQN